MLDQKIDLSWEYVHWLKGIEDVDESTLGGNMMMAVRKSTVNKNNYCFYLFTITRKITINQVTVADLYQPL
jgi:hypothetical protein